MNEKYAVLENINPHKWESCVYISRNLSKCYQLAFPEKIETFNFSNEMSFFSLSELARELAKKNVTKVFFIEHNPCPTIILNLLLKEYTKKDLDLPQLYIHIFGDFPHNLNYWVGAEKLLKKFHVKFFCASKKQCLFIEKFIPKNLVELFPFPVDSKTFSIQEKLREEKRSELNVSSSETLFLYTGRVSEQKNIDELLICFDKHSNENNKLIILGPFDDLGNPYRRRFPDLHGKQFQKISNIINSSKYLSSHVQIINQIPNSQLINYYNAADCFISFSTYHDEDFGMSVAEAKSCGLPVILSDWAGYSSFNQSPEFSNFIEVSYTSSMPQLNTTQAQTRINNFIKASPEQKQKISNEYMEYGSIYSLAKKIKQLTKSNHQFKGFHSISFLIQEFLNIHGATFLNTETMVFEEKIYKSIYNVYYSET